MERILKFRNLLLVFLVTALDLLSGPFLLFVLKNRGIQIYSATQIARYPAQVLAQNLLLCIYPLVLFLICRRLLKESFGRAMCLRLVSPSQWSWTGLLTMLLVIAAALGIRRTGEPVKILYGAVYFVFAVGFAEEFLTHGVCVYLLKDFPWQIRYLLPNFLFALAHVLAFSGFRPVSGPMFLEFVQVQFWPLMASGCCLQLLKDRTGTLWVPVLIHGLMDFCMTYL